VYYSVCVNVDEELIEMGVESRTIRLHMLNAVTALRSQAGMD
jgi:hypothetical protein